MENQVEGDDSDQILVALAKQGDRSAYDRLMLRHQENIAQLMRRFSIRPDILEELTQTVFVKAFMSLRSYEPQAPFVNWLKTIARRVGYDHWRQEYKRKDHVQYDEEKHTGTEPAEAESGIAEETLKRLMASLAPDERQTLYMLYVDEMSVAEVAAAMGWNTAMTKMRSYRARKKLRALLERENALAERSR